MPFSSYLLSYIGIDRKAYPTPSKATIVSTHCDFTREAIESFERKQMIEVPLTPKQRIDMDDSGKTKLQHSQLVQLVRELLAGGDSLPDIIERLHPRKPGVCMSLFVINDDTWKLMAKKEKNPERMLPMTTIPWFLWEEKAESPSNPWGVTRLGPSDGNVRIDPKKFLLIISGNGGDFSGIVEGRITQTEYSRWRAVAPEFPGQTRPVPHYESLPVAVSVSIAQLEADIYPRPQKELDYTFCESPRAYFEHGLLLRTDGSNVRLCVGNRRESQLRGEIRIFIGGPSPDAEARDDLLTHHVWLNSLHKAVTFK